MGWSWRHSEDIGRANFICGYCSNLVGPSRGYIGMLSNSGAHKRMIMICPSCERPTFFDYDKKQTPSYRYGQEVAGISDDSIQKLYNEARDCFSIQAYTSAVMACRKTLMNLAVQKGAPPGQSFMSYVDYLHSTNWIPPNGKEWVDEIRKKGNEANHEIHLMDQQEAQDLVGFVEFLLRIAFEFPTKTRLKN